MSWDICFHYAQRVLYSKNQLCALVAHLATVNDQAALMGNTGLKDTH